MYIFYFDSGTTNSRGYLLDTNGNIINTGEKSVGSKDVAITGKREILISGLKEIYDNVLRESGITDAEISQIYASGMITSPFGLKEVPHSVLPITDKSMVEHLDEFYEGSVFRRNFLLICGAKTRNQDVSMENIGEVNNTRGEEIEVLGICNKISKEWNEQGCIILLPGSHTHALKVKNNGIVDILSNFSGELFYAIATSTILSGEIESKNNERESLDYDFIEKGCELLNKYGLARAIYIIHTTKVFDVVDNEKRRNMLSGIIYGTVAQSLDIQLATKWKDVKKLVVYGDEMVVESYLRAIRYFNKELELCSVYKKYPDCICSVEGLKKILQRKGEVSV